MQKPLEPKQGAKVPLCPSPSTNRFKDDGEYYYFQLFCSQAAPELETCTENQLWSLIVLQASESDDCIRHGVIAIGALDFKDCK